MDLDRLQTRRCRHAAACCSFQVHVLHPVHAPSPLSLLAVCVCAACAVQRGRDVVAALRRLRPWSVPSTPQTRLCLEHVCARNCCCCATSTSTPGNGSVQRLAWHRWAQTCQTPITITKCPLSPALTLPLATHLSLQMAINRWSSRTLTWIPTCSTECALYIRTRDGRHTRCSRCGLLVLTIQPQCCMMIRFHFLHPHFAPSPHAASRATCSRPRSLLGRRSGMFPRKSLQQAK